MLFRAVHTVVAPGRIVPPKTKQEPPETVMSGEDLHQAESENAMTSFQPRLKEGSNRRDSGVASTGLR